MNDKLRQIMGQSIAKARVASNLTQAQVAEIVDLSTRAVSGIERGEYQPTLENLFKIAFILELEPEDLMRSAWQHWLKNKQI